MFSLYSELQEPDANRDVSPFECCGWMGSVGQHPARNAPALFPDQPELKMGRWPQAVLNTRGTLEEQLQRRDRDILRKHANLVYSVCIPALLIAGVNAYNLWNEHWEHWSHLPPLEERVEYPYQNIRTKNFPWGDGDKVRGSS